MRSWMGGAITDVSGIAVGHAANREGLTGCTAVLAHPSAIVGVDVRGAAPGTRETDLCRPGGLVQRADAVLLTGGSAFGLDAAAGVMRALYEQGRGFPTHVMPVPIVPAAVLFDLGIGEPIWPDAAMGYAAATGASTDPPEQGCVGAGMGATVGKIFGPAWATKSGIGTASVRVGELVVGAIVAVNALGDVVDPETGAILAGARAEPGEGYRESEPSLLTQAPVPGSNTTIGVVATNAALDQAAAQRLAVVAHNGLARTIRPAHTLFDGDAIFALATGEVPWDPRTHSLPLHIAAVRAVEGAVLNAVLHAVSLGGLPAAG